MKQNIKSKRIKTLKSYENNYDQMFWVKIRNSDIFILTIILCVFLSYNYSISTVIDAIAPNLSQAKFNP